MTTCQILAVTFGLLASYIIGALTLYIGMNGSLPGPLATLHDEFRSRLTARRPVNTAVNYPAPQQGNTAPPVKNFQPEVWSTRDEQVADEWAARPTEDDLADMEFYQTDTTGWDTK